MTDKKPPFLVNAEKTLERLLDPRRTLIFKPKRDDSPYASLNQRMFATGLDMLWAMFLLGPVILQMRPMIYGAADASAILPQATSREDLTRALLDSGYIFKFILESVLSFLIIAPVFAFCWSYGSTTPGKWLLRLRIVDAKTFRKMTGRQIVLRLIGYGVVVAPLFIAMWLTVLNPYYILSFVLFSMGIWWIYLDRNRRAWHDFIAGTAVVRVKHWHLRDDGLEPHLIIEKQELAEQDETASS